MKVLHVFKTYFPDSYGGIEQTINQIIKATEAFGVESKVLTLTSDSSTQKVNINGYDVFRCKENLNIASNAISFRIFSLYRMLADEADIIHFHYPWPMMDVLHLVCNIKKPTVVTYHSDIVRQKYLLKLYRPLKRCFLSKVDKIVATSPNYISTSKVLNLERYKAKLETIPIGLDKEAYPSPSAKKMHYWENKLGEKFFLFIGVLRYYKGLHILIEAARGTEFPIVIVGAGPVEKELRTQVEKLGLKNVIFLGKVSDEDKAALLKRCFSVVFPSHLRSEAFGVTLLEGAMYGKPMISSEIGTGTSYINIHGETGLVVKPGSSSDLKNAMNRLWFNPELALKMGEKAEQRYNQLFTAEHMASKYAELYKGLICDEKAS